MLKSLALAGTAFVFVVRAGIGLIGWTDQRLSMAFAAQDKDWSAVTHDGESWMVWSAASEHHVEF
jgi:hypothetical protein